MAQQIPCDMCGETSADFMVTNIHTGDTLGVGVECIDLFAQGVTTAQELAEAEAQAEPVDTVTDPESDEPTDEPVDQAEAGEPAKAGQPDDEPAAAEKVEG